MVPAEELHSPHDQRPWGPLFMGPQPAHLAGSLRGGSWVGLLARGLGLGEGEGGHCVQAVSLATGAGRAAAMGSLGR